MIVANSTFEDNTASVSGGPAYGGGININGGSGLFYLRGSTFDNCVAYNINKTLNEYFTPNIPPPSATQNAMGGGINIAGGTISAYFQDSDFENCSAINKYSYAFGGGIAIAGGSSVVGTNQCVD